MQLDKVNWKQVATELYNAARKSELPVCNMLHNAIANYEDTLQMENTAIDFTRVASDINGNGRYACWYGAFISEKDKIHVPLDNRYSLALQRARQFGGRKYNNKSFGGGIVFQTSKPDELEQEIIAYMKTIC